MDKVQLDAVAAEALKAAQPGTELVGPDGKPLGGFVPLNVLYDLKWMMEDRKKKYDEAWAEVSIEELDASFNSGEGIPHEEVLKRLGLG